MKITSVYIYKFLYMSRLISDESLKSLSSTTVLCCIPLILDNKTKHFTNSWPILVIKTFLHRLLPAELKQHLSTGNNCRNVLAIGLKSSICFPITTKI